jgi:hypothetical protein
MAGNTRGAYLQMRKDFYKKYQGKIIPTVQNFENTRRSRLTLAIVISSILFIIATVILIMAFTSNHVHSKDMEGLVKLAIFIYVLALTAWKIIKKKFENSVKEKIMPVVCDCFGDMTWSHGKYVDGGLLFTMSCVIPKYTSESYDDIFQGVFKGVNIDIAESYYVRGTGKNRRTVFDGVIVKLDMNKFFTSHTVIKPNGLIKAPPSSDLHHTNLEDVEFNKKYDVYTDDDVDARYLITPSFMERLKSVKMAFRASSVSCAFYEKYLIIALPTKKDLFSLCSLIKPMDDRVQYFQMYNEIESIIKLIDHFKLDQKLGL